MHSPTKKVHSLVLIYQMKLSDENNREVYGYVLTLKQWLDRTLLGISGEPNLCFSENFTVTSIHIMQLIGSTRAKNQLQLTQRLALSNRGLTMGRSWLQLGSEIVNRSR